MTTARGPTKSEGADRRGGGSRGRSGATDGRTIQTAPPRGALAVVAAFASGAAVMILELGGTRLLAPWFGNTLYLWTGLIGVVLVALSLGYYLGGRLADRRPNPSTLAHLLAAAAVATALVPSLHSAAAASVGTMDFLAGPVVASLLLLALPACLLAGVCPVAVKLLSATSADRRVGFSAGTVSMAATLGSVVGTFAAGFVLIPHVALRTIFVAVAAVLAVLAAAGYLARRADGPRRTVGAIALLAAVGVLGGASLESPDGEPDTVFDRTTFYHRIRVVDQPGPSGDTARYLLLDTTYEGGRWLRSDGYPLRYQRYWELSRALVPGLRRALFIGGGGFLMPERLLDAFPQAEADVVEIDPAVIEVGRRFFRLDEYPRLHAVADDGRRFLRRTEHRYDLVVGDAYNGVQQIPTHLVTVEFFELIRARLAPGGVYLMNVRSALEGRQSGVFHAVDATLRAVFDEVELLATEPARPSVSQNVIFVASTERLPIAALAAEHVARGGSLGELLATYVPRSASREGRGPVLTDDYNPVEYLIARGLSSRY